MAKLSERPHKNLAQLRPREVEANQQHYDDVIRKLDNRRIVQISEASAGSTDAETISNLLSKMNELLAALNASDLTEE